VETVTTGYSLAGASGLSVLTDGDFFGGSNDDLIRARAVNACPILRKEFILDAWQVFEARSIGADAILLIAAILTPAETLELATLARSLGMETILEVHGKTELDHLNDQISLLGVNNRNLGDFTVSLDISLSLSRYITGGMPAISESGIHHPEDIKILKEAGYSGFLIGEQFMATLEPAAACRSFINRLNHFQS
jgi:indole-3-glycerol phosphate synthase